MSTTPTVYIEREGRQFGLEDRVKVKRKTPDGQTDKVLYDVTPTSVWTFPVLRARIWGLLHGYGWLPVGS